MKRERLWKICTPCGPPSLFFLREKSRVRNSEGGGWSYKFHSKLTQVLPYLCVIRLHAEVSEVEPEWPKQEHRLAPLRSCYSPNCNQPAFPTTVLPTGNLSSTFILLNGQNTQYEQLQVKRYQVSGLKLLRARIFQLSITAVIVSQFFINSSI